MLQTFPSSNRAGSLNRSLRANNLTLENGIMRSSQAVFIQLMLLESFRSHFPLCLPRTNLLGCELWMVFSQWKKDIGLLMLILQLICLWLKAPIPIWLSTRTFGKLFGTTTFSLGWLFGLGKQLKTSFLLTLNSTSVIFAPWLKIPDLCWGAKLMTLFMK